MNNLIQKRQHLLIFPLPLSVFIIALPTKAYSPYIALVLNELCRFVINTHACVNIPLKEKLSKLKTDNDLSEDCLVRSLFRCQAGLSLSVGFETALMCACMSALLNNNKLTDSTQQSNITPHAFKRVHQLESENTFCAYKHTFRVKLTLPQKSF